MKEEKSCTPPHEDGYLLWTGYLPEFNNQLITLAETILFNQALPKPRKLVLTGFMELKDPGTSLNASDGIDYEEDVSKHVLHETKFAIDIEQTVAAFGGSKSDWLVPEDLKDVCNMDAEAHAFIHYFEIPATLPGGRMSYTRTNYHVQEKIWHGNGTANQAHYISELKDYMQFPTAKITVHDSQDILYMHKIANASVAPMLILDYLFYTMHNVHPPYADTAYPVFDVIGKVVWSKAVRETARDFRNTYLTSTETKFIALHWRRGFHVAKAGTNNEDSADISYSHESVAKFLKRRSEKGCPGCPIYIASNNITHEDVTSIRSLMGTGQEVNSMMVNPPNVNLNTLSRAEMLLCKEAHIFIPSSSSTWSATVLAQRGVKITGPPAARDTTDDALEEFAMNDGLGYEPQAWDRDPKAWPYPDWSSAAAKAKQQHADLDRKAAIEIAKNMHHTGQENGPSSGSGGGGGGGDGH